MSYNFKIFWKLIFIFESCVWLIITFYVLYIKVFVWYIILIGIAFFMLICDSFMIKWTMESTTPGIVIWHIYWILHMIHSICGHLYIRFGSSFLVQFHNNICVFEFNFEKFNWIVWFRTSCVNFFFWVLNQ